MRFKAQIEVIVEEGEEIKKWVLHGLVKYFLFKSNRSCRIQFDLLKAKASPREYLTFWSVVAIGFVSTGHPIIVEKWIGTPYLQTTLEQ